MSNSIEVRACKAVAVVTLNAPDRRNAISPEMREEAIDALRALGEDPACRAIVITGAGGHFSAGGDLKAAGANGDVADPARTKKNLILLQEMVRLIACGPRPVVAAVEGVAFGAGMSLAVAADYVVAARGAKFCAAFSRIGLLPDAGLLWSLPLRVGAVRAKQLMLSAAVVEAEEALSLGLVDQVVDDGAALDAAIARAEQLARAAPLTVAAVKAVFGQGVDSLDAVFAAEVERQPVLSSSQDYFEGRAAFRERRAPVFKGV